MKKIDKEKAVFWVITVLYFPFMHFTHLDGFWFGSIRHLWRDSLVFKILYGLPFSSVTIPGLIAIVLLLIWLGILLRMLVKKILTKFKGFAENY